MTRRGTRSNSGQHSDRSTGASAAGGLSSIPITHQANNTSRPNAADMPYGSKSGARGQPRSGGAGGSPKAIQSPGLIITDLPNQRRKIFDHNGHHVGTVGPHAGLPTVARFLGHHHATLKGGEWRANKPSAPARVSSLPLGKSLKSDKGSVRK